MRFSVIFLITLAALLLGCADPGRQAATAALDVATATIRAAEDFDRGHKRELAARAIAACASTPAGPIRDGCLERETAPLRSYQLARQPLLDALAVLEQAAAAVEAARRGDGVALSAAIGRAAEAAGHVLLLLAPLRASGAGGAR